MPLVIPCTHCQRPIRVPDNAVGKAVRCPLCSGVVRVNAQPTPPPAAVAIQPPPVPAPPPRTLEVEPSGEPEENLNFTTEPPARRRPPGPRSTPAGRRKPWVVALALVVGAVAFGLAFFLARGLVTGLLGGGSISDADWQEVRPAGEKFRVLMPGNPRHESKKVANNTIEQYTVERGGRITFMLLIAHLSDGEVRAMPWATRFQLGLKGMLSAEAGSRLKAEKTVTLAGNPGMEFIVEVPMKGVAVTRIYGLHQGGRNIYLTIGAAGPDYGPDSPPVAKFFNSLQLDRESPDALGGQLASAPRGKRLELIAELKKQGKEASSATPALAAVVKDTQDYMAAMAAAEVLGEIGPAAAAAVPTLRAVLKTQHPRKLGPDNGNLRLQLAAALVRIDPKDALAREVLQDCKKDSNAVVGINARYYLLKLDPAGNAADLDELVRIWQNGTWERSNAAEALKKLGPLAAKAVPVLTEAVRGKDDPRRRSAIDILGALGPAAREALPALRALDAPPSPEDLRMAVREACRKIEGAS
jgi:hypothetical protein